MGLLEFPRPLYMNAEEAIKFGICDVVSKNIMGDVYNG